MSSVLLCGSPQSRMESTCVALVAWIASDAVVEWPLKAFDVNEDEAEEEDDCHRHHDDGNYTTTTMAKEAA